MIRPPVASRSRSSATTTSTFAQRRPLDDLGDDARCEDRRIDPRDRRAVGLEQLEQPLVAEGRHLDRLAEGGPQLALGERPQDVDVDDDRGRLVERPDEVLALGQVDPGLAADRRIDLGDERRRDLDERDAAQVDRGQEPGRVAERAAADRDERLAALDPQSRQLAGRRLDDGEPLGGLALGQQDVRDVAAAIAQAGRQPLARPRPRRPAR